MCGNREAVGATGDGGLDQALAQGRAAFLGFLEKRLRNREEAEDVLQEFCIRVLARQDQLRDAERLDAWYMRSCARRSTTISARLGGGGG